MKKLLYLLYGVSCYLALAGTALYAVGFAGNLLIEKTIDSATQSFFLPAVLTDAALIILFALLYSILKKPLFKRWCKKFVPAALQRSTYVLLASLCALLLMWQWQPLGGIVWSVEDELLKAILQIIYFSGWSIVVVSTFLINHFDLFGLRQVWMYFKGSAYTPLASRLPFMYTLARHPIYIGFAIVLWSVPVMTITHLLFASFLFMFTVKQGFVNRRNMEPVC